MSQFKRFDASEGRNYNTSHAFPEGTLTWDPGNGLRIHDGYTASGNAVGITDYSSLNNRPYGSSAIHDLLGGGSSANDGMVLQQYNTNQVAWVKLDLGDLTDNNGLLYSRYQLKSSSFAAEVGKTYWVDSTSSTISVTLPATPAAGDWIKLYDGEMKWQTRDARVATQGSGVA